MTNIPRWAASLGGKQMSKFFCGDGARALILTGVMAFAGLSVASLMFGGHANAAGPGVAAPTPVPMVRVGERLRSAGRIHSGPAVLRSPKDAADYAAAHPELNAIRATHRPFIPMGLAAYRLAKQAAAQEAAAQRASRNKPAVAPADAPLLVSRKAISGPAQSDPENAVFPPDVSAAVGGGQIVVVVNNSYNVYNERGKPVLNQSFNDRLGTTDQLSGPRVIYDPLWKRWIFSLVSIPTASEAPSVWLAISQTSRADGALWIYHFSLPLANGDIFDYAMLGMTQDSILMTGNHSSGKTFIGSLLFGLPKSHLYNGLNFSVLVVGAPAAVGTVAPPIVLDSSDRAFFLAADSGTSLDLYVGTDLGTNEAAFTLQAQIPNTYSVPPDAPQFNQTRVLDTLDGRFQGPSTQYRNSDGNTVLWNVHTIDDNGFPTPAFDQIDATNNAILHAGFFYESDNSRDFNASIAANTNDEAFVVWNSTDPTAGTGHNARILFSGLQPGDANIATGTALVTSRAALTGDTQTHGVEAWGAYSAVALDPTAQAGACAGATNRHALIASEKILNRSNWGTEFALIGFC